MLEMALDDQEIINRFPVGYYPLHPNVSLNFQMNRFWNWVGDNQMLDELRAAGTRIKNYDDWAREMFDLSDKALAAGRRLPAAVDRGFRHHGPLRHRGELRPDARVAGERGRRGGQKVRPAD